MAWKPKTRCTSCRRLFEGTGKCPECKASQWRKIDDRRGSARARGYDREHEERFRAVVLAEEPICVVCGQAPSTVADHYPLSRRELVAQGLDPNDPQYGRGVCAPCHNLSTTQHEPGGWNRR